MHIRKWLWGGLAFGFLAGAGQRLSAEEATPVGRWQTIDDVTSKPRFLVQISELNGEYSGQVEEIFPRPGEDPAHLCNNCQGSLRDQPVVGMKILWGLKKQDGQRYAGGRVLDPDNGKTYKASLRVSDDSQELVLRGFIGVSMLGRSQTWRRAL
jgi:uncharacterized protein (DUF2147 family)